MSPIIKITFKEDNNLSMDVIKATLEMQLSNVVESVEVVDPAKPTTSHSLSDRLTRIEARLGLEIGDRADVLPDRTRQFLARHVYQTVAAADCDG